MPHYEKIWSSGSGNLNDDNIHLSVLPFFSHLLSRSLILSFDLCTSARKKNAKTLKKSTNEDPLKYMASCVNQRRCVSCSLWCWERARFLLFVICWVWFGSNVLDRVNVFFLYILSYFTFLFNLCYLLLLSLLIFVCC